MLNFPANPSNNDTYVTASGEYVYDSARGLWIFSAFGTVIPESINGFINSTIKTFPGSLGNVDYGLNESVLSTSRDAFGVILIDVHDCMEPAGSLVTVTDFAVLV